MSVLFRKTKEGYFEYLTAGEVGRLSLLDKETLAVYFLKIDRGITIPLPLLRAPRKLL